MISLYQNEQEAETNTIINTIVRVSVYAVFSLFRIENTV